MIFKPVYTELESNQMAERPVGQSNTEETGGVSVVSLHSSLRKKNLVQSCKTAENVEECKKIMKLPQKRASNVAGSVIHENLFIHTSS